MDEELLYRAAVRNDIKGEIRYYRGTLSNILRFLQRERNGLLEIDPNDRVYLVPANHRLPWEIPPEERTDANLLPEERYDY